MFRLVTAALTAALAACGGFATRGVFLSAGHPDPPAVTSTAAARHGVPGPLYGLTVDRISNLNAIVAADRRLPYRPVTRIYFDVRHGPGYYLRAVRRLHQVSYLMGELLDSSDEPNIPARAFRGKISSYLSALGRSIDIWEIGNEVNGAWTGHYTTVSTKLTEAYHAVAARGYRTALTLYYNAGCGDGRGELGPLTFSRRYVPPAVRDRLGYVLVSYYEDDCRNIRPSTAAWTSFFRKLHALYPNARLGFGEIGMNRPATPRTLATAQSLVSRYYGLRIKLPYYAGGYFWWYYAEDCLPYTVKPLWQVLSAAFHKETAAIGRSG